MSREILFKAKRKYNGEWVEGYYVYCRKRHYILPLKNETIGFNGIEDEWVEVNSDTICQYTGGRDKYHKIWENDICEVNTQNIDEEDGYFVVQWDAESLRFVLTGNDLVLDFDNFGTGEVEVIGNIFDNQEPLEVGE